MLIQDQLTEQFIGAAIEVHRELGPGLLESAYEECFCHELHLRNFSFRRQVDLPVAYKDLKLDCGYRLGIVIENLVVVELKSIGAIPPCSSSTATHILALEREEVGLLINFNVAVLKNGIVRRVL